MLCFHLVFIQQVAIHFMRNIHLIASLTLLAATLALGGCKPQIDSQVNQKPQSATQEVLSNHHLTSSNECFTVTTDWQAKAKVNNYFFFDITLKESCIAPEHIGAMTLYADMPAHGHGTNSQPMIKAISPWVYRVEGMLLHMPGDWLITLELPYTQKNQQHLEIITFNAIL